MQSADVSTSGGFDSSLGALLVTTLLSMTCVPFFRRSSRAYCDAFSLWGVTCVQVYEYFLDNLDRLLQKSIVNFFYFIAFWIVLSSACT